MFRRRPPNGHRNCALESLFTLAIYVYNFSNQIFLDRYHLEVGDLYSRRLAHHYYQLATVVDASNGWPHNQLGVLDVGRCYGLNSVYHYMRSIMSRNPFDGAKRNLVTILLRNEERYVNLMNKRHPMPSLQSQVYNRKAAIRLKDLCFTILKFLYLIHRNTQSYLKSESTGLETSATTLLQQILDDTSFLLRSETKRFGAKCVAHMLPRCADGLTCLPDFCPDPEMFARQKTASTPLMAPILLRMLLTNILLMEFLVCQKVEPTAPNRPQESTQSDGSEKGNDSVAADTTKSPINELDQLFQRAGELPLFTLSFLDLLLTHSAHALNKTVNMFKVAASRLLQLPPQSIQSATNVHRARREDTKDEVKRQKNARVTLKNIQEEEEVMNSQNESEASRDESGDRPELTENERTPEEEVRETESTYRGRASSDSETAPSVDDRRRRRLRPLTDNSAPGVVEVDDFSDFLQDSSDTEFSDNDGDEDDSESESWNSDDTDQLHSQNSDSLMSDEDYEHDYGNSRSTGRQKKLNTIAEEDSSFGHSSALGPSIYSARTYPKDSGWGRPRVISDRGESRNECGDKSPEVYDNSTGEETEKRINVDSETCQPYFGEKEKDYDRAVEEAGGSEVESFAVSTAEVTEEERDEEEEGMEEEGNSESYSGSRQPKPSEGMWIRLFVAAHFVDTLLCGIKLLTDWLTCSPEFLQRAAHSHHSLVQQISWHLAGLLNYLNPIVLCTERELHQVFETDAAITVYRGLPITFTVHPHGILEHVSLRCRQILRAEMVSTVMEESAETCMRQPLPEDWFLRDLPRLAPVYCNLRFEKGNLEDRIEEALLRCMCLVHFGRWFSTRTAQLGIDFNYHADSGYFTASPPRSIIDNAKQHTHRRGRPWLRHYGHGHTHEYKGRGRNRPPMAYRPCARIANPTPSTPQQEFETITLQDECTEDPIQRSNVEQSYARVVQMSAWDQTATQPNKLTERRPEEKSKSDARREESMRNMARLRLINQVDTLSQMCQTQRVHSGAFLPGKQKGLPSAEFDATSTVTAADSSVDPDQPSNMLFLSPYLVLDTYCLLGHLPFVKRILHSQRFVLVIPAAVIAHLDYLKKVTAAARSVIRFLEEQTHQGNRHLRIQTEAEKSDYQLNLRLPRPDFAKDSSPEEPNGEPGLPQASSRVVRRWLSIFDCALFFSSLSQSEPPAASSQLDQLEPDTPGDDNSDTTEVINILKFRSHMTKRGSPKNKSPTVTVLIGSRTACQEDLLVPLRLVDMALKLGVSLEPILEFCQRWRNHVLRV
uniref:Protein SMG5 n=1 Tax=Schistocephalus solidus TaxID=70667 RepID=A0A0X3NZF5_SCHSO